MMQTTAQLVAVNKRLCKRQKENRKHHNQQPKYGHTGTKRQNEDKQVTWRMIEGWTDREHRSETIRQAPKLTRTVTMTDSRAGSESSREANSSDFSQTRSVIKWEPRDSLQ